MRYKLFILILTAMTILNQANAQQLAFAKVKQFERQLDDVMEITDTTELKLKLTAVEAEFRNDPSEINKARLGIIYHETALNLTFLSQTGYKGYARRSYDTLTDLFNAPATTRELLPFVASYRASALALTGAETKQLKLLSQAFGLFDEAVKSYRDISYAPAFLRGSVSENLPWFFFRKRKFAALDFQSIIDRQTENPEYANWKIMSFTYWAWANQHQRKKDREQALGYLEKAITLDPNNKAGRKRAEDLKKKMTRYPRN